MRFSAIIPTVFLVLLLAIFVTADTIYNSNQLLSSDNIEYEMIRLLKRQEAPPATTSTTAATATTTSSTGPTMIGKSVQALPDILQTGTLFYIGISVTTLLWCTGKVIDVKMDRQERYAQSLVHSI